MHDEYVLDLQDSIKSRAEEAQKNILSAHETLTKEWGDEKSERYKRNVELAKRSIRELGGEELNESFKKFGILTDQGYVQDAAIAKMLAEVGKQLYAEDDIFSAEVRESNPFDSKTENMTAQGQIFAADPELAKRLIRSVGREKDFPTVMGR